MNTTGNYTTNQGDLTIEQTGENVNGKYSKTGVFSGSISGNVIAGIWKNLGKEGLFEFVFEDDLSFKGKYKIGTEPGTMRSKWDGQITNLNNTEVSKDKTTKEKNEPKTVSEKKNGIAKWVDEEGNVFDGTWENDILIKGIIAYHDGSLEEGEFNEEELNGKGKCSYKDDEGELVVEEGEFLDGLLIKGTITWESGRKEEGEFDEEGLLHGEGKNYYNDDEGGYITEEGIFEHGTLTQGKITWAGGSSASGFFDENLELNGKGIYSWADGDYKEGIWEHGNFVEGRAKITHDDGDVSEGLMKNGEWVEALDDVKNNYVFKTDVVTYEGGDRYEGEILNGNRHGKGKYIWADGDIYEGDFIDGKRTGKGNFIWINGDIYDGDFVDGKRTGKGKYSYKDDDELVVKEGEFKDGILIKGKRQWGEWGVSEGEFNEEGLNGEGERLYKSGRFEKGIFKDGIFIEGTCKMLNDDDEDNEELYEGDFKDRKRHGTGTLKYNNGDFYEGEFNDGKFHGKGTLKFKNGDVYEGEFKDDNRHGFGTFFDKQKD